MMTSAVEFAHMIAMYVMNRNQPTRKPWSAPNAFVTKPYAPPGPGLRMTSL